MESQFEILAEDSFGNKILYVDNYSISDPAPDWEHLVIYNSVDGITQPILKEFDPCFEADLYSEIAVVQDSYRLSLEQRFLDFLEDRLDDDFSEICYDDGKLVVWAAFVSRNIIGNKFLARKLVHDFLKQELATRTKEAQ